MRSMYFLRPRFVIPQNVLASTAIPHTSTNFFSSFSHATFAGATTFTPNLVEPQRHFCGMLRSTAIVFNNSQFSSQPSVNSQQTDFGLTHHFEDFQIQKVRKIIQSKITDGVAVRNLTSQVLNISKPLVVDSQIGAVLALGGVGTSDIAKLTSEIVEVLKKQTIFELVHGSFKKITEVGAKNFDRCNPSTTTPLLTPYANEPGGEHRIVMCRNDYEDFASRWVFPPGGVDDSTLDEGWMSIKQTKDVVVVTGESGVGKTVSTMYFAADKGVAVYIRGANLPEKWRDSATQVASQQKEPNNTQLNDIKDFVVKAVVALLCGKDPFKNRQLAVTQEEFDECKNRLRNLHQINVPTALSLIFDDVAEFNSVFVHGVYEARTSISEQLEEILNSPKIIPNWIGERKRIISHVYIFFIGAGTDLNFVRVGSEPPFFAFIWLVSGARTWWRLVRRAKTQQERLRKQDAAEFLTKIDKVVSCGGLHEMRLKYPMLGNARCATIFLEIVARFCDLVYNTSREYIPDEQKSAAESVSFPGEAALLVLVDAWIAEVMKRLNN